MDPYTIKVLKGNYIVIYFLCLLSDILIYKMIHINLASLRLLIFSCFFLFFFFVFLTLCFLRISPNFIGA